MKRKPRKISAIVLSWVLFFSVASAADSLRFSKNISNEQKSLLQKDLTQFENLSAKETDPEFRRVLGLSGAVTPTLLLNWLSLRVKFIVSEKFDLTKAVRFSRSIVHYPFPELVPDPVLSLTDLQVENDQRSERGMNLKNIGSSLYVLGKFSGQKIAVTIPGQGEISVRSPRVGIIQAGEALFKSLRGSLDLRSPENMFVRLERLFHEARHSDGNGKNIGFAHSLCPAGHLYAGAAVCDFSLNGAYSVSAYWGKYFTENCLSCTVAQKEAMRLYYLDSYSRIFAERASEKNGDDDLSALLAAKESCDYYKKVVGSDRGSLCANIDERISRVREGRSNSAGSVYLDDKTESLL